MNKSNLLFVLTALLCLVNAQPYYTSDSVLLEQVRVLTFHQGQMTTGRRSAPLSQLQCVGGSAQGNREYYPSSVQCTNVGSDGTDVQWKCEADLDSSVRFGKTIVSCEGYSYPDDPYVLKGSCGLEYSLEFTEQGRQNKAQGSSYYGNNHASQPYYHQTDQGFSWGNVVMMVILAFIIFGLVSQCQQNQGRTGGGPTGGGGFGPGNNPYPGGDPYHQGGSYPPGCAPAPNYYGGTSTFQPGFWSGVGTGGLLGYLLRPRTYGYGGYNTGYYPNTGLGGAPSFRSSGWGSSSSFGSSSAPRTASAFASTRRR